MEKFYQTLNTYLGNFFCAVVVYFIVLSIITIYDVRNTLFNKMMHTY